ncbi:MAG: MoxR family ATPase [Propionibacterium sp.]|nr:MoxR family ATPase [Propionibacterium sp.]MDN6793913.1 MoxR family ATPase [Propionibacterium sp.]
MALSPEEATRFARTFASLVDNVSVALLDKSHVIRLALTTLFAGGHLLLEDAPGTGKTALARAIAATIDGSNSRIQFTPDMLPSDITGVNMYDQSTGEWHFHQGPVFAEVVLADEINRASPKTQSALLEVMEEAQVTVDGVSHPAGSPFMVIATQNPVEQAGTYPLPEAQLDRFLMKTSLGYPSRAAMIDVLAGAAAPDRSRMIRPVVATNQVQRLSELVADTHTDRAVLDYIAALAEATRDDESATLGVSTRGAIGMARCSRVWAAAQGRNFVLPDDVKALAGPVWTHRIMVDPDASFSGATAAGIVSRALTTVPAPAAGA